jgi:hypothetical protein
MILRANGAKIERTASGQQGPIGLLHAAIQQGDLLREFPMERSQAISTISKRPERPQAQSVHHNRSLGGPAEFSQRREKRNRCEAAKLPHDPSLRDGVEANECPIQRSAPIAYLVEGTPAANYMATLDRARRSSTEPSPGRGLDCPCPELQVARVSCESISNRFRSSRQA